MTDRMSSRSGYARQVDSFGIKKKITRQTRNWKFFAKEKTQTDGSCRFPIIVLQVEEVGNICETGVENTTI
jgi:hypothetical protein